jgi:Flp pilus assembly protein TadD
MDALLHAAIRARWDNNLQAARTALDSLLQLNPVSASAYAELGATYIAARDCAAARKSLDQAISIIEAGTDKENPRFGQPPLLRHWVGGLQSASLSCK